MFPLFPEVFVSIFFSVCNLKHRFSAFALQQSDKEPYKISSGAKSEAKLPAVYRAHHNARILCVMEHPTLKTRLNSSLLLDVQCKQYFQSRRFSYICESNLFVSIFCHSLCLCFVSFSVFSDIDSLTECDSLRIAWKVNSENSS